MKNFEDAGGGNLCPSFTSSDGPSKKDVEGDGGWELGQTQDVEEDGEKDVPLPRCHSRRLLSGSQNSALSLRVELRGEQKQPRSSHSSVT